MVLNLLWCNFDNKFYETNPNCSRYNIETIILNIIKNIIISLLEIQIENYYEFLKAILSFHLNLNILK